MTRMQATEVAFVAAALGVDTPAKLSAANLEQAIGNPSDNVSYLILSVLTARIPTDDDVRSFTREWRASDLPSVINQIPPRLRRLSRSRRVRLSSGVVVDVTDTARSPFTTGIQRVVRETLSRWSADRELELVVWDSTNRTFVRANAEQASRASLGTVRASGNDVIVPFRASFFLPEISVDAERTAALRTIALHSASSTVAVGFDCIPVTTAETAGPGMPGAFSQYLSTLARFTVILPISEAAGAEYRGWRDMLAGAGLTGPAINVVSLPTAIASVRPSSSREVGTEAGADAQPMVLAVGSREPRKNHLNLLHACELNWQAGRKFSLVLVGGNAWETRRVDELIERLQRRGRDIVVLTSVEDDVLDELYDQSRFTVFCSLNEGFGLPVVESLSRGTPVLTSSFGSMAELGWRRGALDVDPHDPRAIADAIARMLDDDALTERLKSEARVGAGWTWDDYTAAIRGILLDA